MSPTVTLIAKLCFASTCIIAAFLAVTSSARTLQDAADWREAAFGWFGICAGCLGIGLGTIGWLLAILGIV